MFVKAAREKGAYPVLITPLTRRCYRDPQAKYSHGPYAAAMRELARELCVPIDLTAESEKLVDRMGEDAKQLYMNLPAGRFSHYPDGLEDNTHLQPAAFAGRWQRDCRPWAALTRRCFPTKPVNGCANVHSRESKREAAIRPPTFLRRSEEHGYGAAYAYHPGGQRSGGPPGAGACWPGLVETATPAGAPLSHWAAREGSLAMLRLLVEYGTKMNLNAVDENGRDMLHYAAEGGNVKKCRYLVERGGMVPLRGDLELITPYDLAHQGGWKQLEAYFAAVVGAPWEAMYRNPIRSGMYPDPSICRVGEDYYMVNSTFVYFPCIPVSHSRDLVHWEVIGHAITRSEWANLEGLEGGRGYWAPDISYAEGRFYICATLRLNDGGEVCRRQMVVTAQRPEGPYSEPVFFEEDGIDPSLFHDTDGRHYMLLNRGARIFEVDAQATRRLSETTLLYYGSCKRAPEGPHLLKKDGWYYLFLAEGGTGMGHRETVARSRNLHGPYEPSPYGPVLRQWDERALIQRCGHAKPVSTPDGRWYLVYLCGRALEGQWTLLGRETALDPIQWTADGWPLLNHGRGPSVLQRKPLPDAPVHGSVDWLTPRPPQPGTVHWCGERLILRAGDSDLTEVSCRSLQVRRQTAFRCSFAATVTVPRQGEAGSCLLL